MQPMFAIIAVATLGSAIAAMSLRNLVHCALCLAVALGGLAALFLLLGAQFVGLAQLLVYVGAVAILVVFAILLTRGSELPRQPAASPAWFLGLGVAVLVAGTLLAALAGGGGMRGAGPPAVSVTVRAIGSQLMTRYLLPLELAGVLLTVALIGAVIIAMRERGP